MGVVIPHADGFPGMKMHYFRAQQWKRGEKELREGGTWETNSQKKYVKLLLFLFLPFFLKSKYISRLDDCQIIDQTRKVVVCVCVAWAIAT